MFHIDTLYEFQVIFQLIFHLFSILLVEKHYLCATSATKV